MKATDQIWGMPAVISEHCLETVPRFPDKKRTKRRMRRVRGKYGSWTVERPCAYQLWGKIFVHPSIAYKMKMREELRGWGAGST